MATGRRRRVSPCHRYLTVFLGLVVPLCQFLPRGTTLFGHRPGMVDAKLSRYEASTETGYHMHENEARDTLESAYIHPEDQHDPTVELHPSTHHLHGAAYYGSVDGVVDALLAVPSSHSHLSDDDIGLQDTDGDPALVSRRATHLLLLCEYHAFAADP